MTGVLPFAVAVMGRGSGGRCGLHHRDRVPLGLLYIHQLWHTRPTSRLLLGAMSEIKEMMELVQGDGDGGLNKKKLVFKNSH
ncbi:hypothetical protein OIU76_022673 [Salix suchowensis]|nr:hypothetical protein OIU76_022673 [Salix suchowensis]